MKDEKFRKVLDKIRKLLQMTKSPYPEEAATALSMAKDLMLKHKIEMQDLDETTEDIIEIDFRMTKNQDAEVCLAYWLGKAFFVKAINVKTKEKTKILNSIRFIGCKSDVAVSTYIYAYMMNLIDIHSKEYFKELSDEDKAKSTRTKILADYAFGFVTAVNEKLKKMEEDRLAARTSTEVHDEYMLVISTNALIISHMHENYPNLNEGKDKNILNNENHFINGFIEGEKHGIFRGVESNKTKKEIN
jgi:hypothetical protein